MENQRIKEEAEELQKTIENTKRALNELRNQCKHEETIIGEVSWRVGVTNKHYICHFCGKVLDPVNPLPKFEVTTTTNNIQIQDLTTNDYKGPRVIKIK